MSNRVYDVLKWTAISVLPALVALTAAVGSVWGWELATPVAATIAAINTALGTVLGISSSNYNTPKENE